MTPASDQSGAPIEGSAALIPAERIESRIYLIRGEKVILDSDLAEFYGVATKALNQAVRRNHERFPSDFMFQLTEAEADVFVRSQFVAAKSENSVNPLNIKGILRSQFVTAKRIGTGGRRYLPYAFTEQGVAMLSGLLNSPRAIAVNIGIMRAFVRLRQLIASNSELAQARHRPPRLRARNRRVARCFSPRSADVGLSQRGLKHRATRKFGLRSM